LALNHFGDLNEMEMKELMRPQPNIKRSEISKKNNKAEIHKISGKQLPDYVNWVEQGAVTNVKDQGICGSCWTFGTTGAMEGAWFLKSQTLTSLSEQQLVDCAWATGGPFGDSGCDGGFTFLALQWVMQNGGIALESSYPYLMQDHWCSANDTSSGLQLTGYVNITSGDEDSLKDAVANDGPVAIAIDASQPTFTFYTGGVYSDPNCKNDIDSLDHEVLIVGYGTDPDSGMDYWLVKNSWSVYWGDNGYIKMQRGVNMCGVATQANYAYF